VHCKYQPVTFPSPEANHHQVMTTALTRISPVWSEIMLLRIPWVRITIYRLLVRVRATGTTTDRRRSGRPRDTTLRHDRHITLIHLRSRFATAD
jgi:hypothetical protein